jgi:putative ABC transport system substrate-binding protein
MTVDSQRRRWLVTAIFLLAVPGRGLSQWQPGRIPKIGFLGVSTAASWAPRLDAFREGLRELGYVEGKNIVVEYRFAEGHNDRVAGLAAELVRLKVDVIVTHSATGALAAKQATAADPIPVVMTNVGDAVGWGIVSNLARPGGNITGDTFFLTELVGKRLEVLKGAIPRVQRVAALGNPENAGSRSSLQALESAAKDLNLRLLKFHAINLAELENAFAAMTAEKAEALVVIEEASVIIPNRSRIAELATRHRLPSIGFIEYCDAGGLFGYGVNFFALYRRAPFFVDRILRGAKPGDIPIERPTTFEFVINGKTAKALGLTVPPALRLRADRMID